MASRARFLEAIPFDAFSELSVTMQDPVIKVNGSIARVVGFEKVRGRMKDGQDFAWTALGTNIYEKREGKWLIVHHHASKAAEELVLRAARQGIRLWEETPDASVPLEMGFIDGLLRGSASCNRNVSNGTPETRRAQGAAILA